MTLLAPWGLLALLALPAVVVLHLYRTRLPERRVAASFLFPPQLLRPGAGRRRTALLRSPSLWCELLAALLLAAWLAGPSFGGGTVRPLVVVLDDAGSLAAVGARERGLSKLRSALAARGAGGSLAVVATGPRPTVLLDPRDPAPDLEAALRRWQPARPRHDIGFALDFARELAGSDGELWFVGDELPPPGHEDVALLACGEPAANAALQTISRGERADGSGDEVRVRIAVYGTMAAVALSLRADGRELAAATVPVADGLATFVAAVPPGTDVVQVQLGPDALPLDDVAWLLPRTPRVVAVADELPAERRRDLALDRVFAALPEWQPAAAARSAQLLLRAAPGAVGEGQLEVVLASGDGEVQAWSGPFLCDRASPWLRGVQLQGVSWAAGALELPGQVLVAAGAQVLASEEPLPVGRRLWLRVQPGGNLVRAPDWPVLFANVLDGCRAEVPGPVAAHVLVGGEARWRRGPGAATAPLQLVGPDGVPQAGHAGATVGWVVHAPGVHTVQDAAGTSLGRFAARFHDPGASDLRAVVAGDRPAAPTAARGAARQAPLRDTGRERDVLAALLLAVLLLDWWLLARRDA